jgi:hypothetical protein
MTIQTTAYYFDQRIEAINLESKVYQIPWRYEVVYSKTLTASKTNWNKIQIQILNTSQKKVNLTGKTLKFRIFDHKNRVVIEKLSDPLFPVTGLAIIQFSGDDISDLPKGRYTYSLELGVAGKSETLYLSTSADVRGNIDIIDGSGVIEFSPLEVTMPSTGPLFFSPDIYASSIFEGNDTGVTTIQFILENFTGEIKVEGSTLPDFSVPYLVKSIGTYTSKNGSVGDSLMGHHPYLRSTFTVMHGSVVDISTHVKKILVK